MRASLDGYEITEDVVQTIWCLVFASKKTKRARTWWDGGGSKGSGFEPKLRLWRRDDQSERDKIRSPRDSCSEQS